MKRIFITIVAAWSLCLPAGAQQAESAKNIYYAGREDTKPTPARKRRGRIGAMVKTELQRDGKAHMVPPSSTFRSGDRLRLHIRINRSGYLTVLNQGTRGDLQLLYPKTVKDARTPITPTKDFTIPTTSGRWLKFDEVTGNERLIVMLSAQPIPDVLGALNAIENGGGNPARPPGNPSAAPTQEQEIVDAMNSKAFRGAIEESTNRDLTEVEEAEAEDGQPAAFAVSSSSNANLRKPIVYRLTLKHAR